MWREMGRVCLRLSRKDGRESSCHEISMYRHCWSAAGRKGHTHKPGRGSLRKAEWGKRVNHSLLMSSLLGLFTLEGHLLDEINYLVAMSRSLGIKETWSSAIVCQSRDPEHMTFPSVLQFPGCPNKITMSCLWGRAILEQLCLRGVQLGTWHWES